MNITQFRQRIARAEQKIGALPVMVVIDKPCLATGCVAGQSSVFAPATTNETANTWGANNFPSVENL